jgi:hypothetical protein
MVQYKVISISQIRRIFRILIISVIYVLFINKTKIQLTISEFGKIRLQNHDFDFVWNTYDTNTIELNSKLRLVVNNLNNF